MLQIEKMTAAHLGDVITLSVEEQQQHYVGKIDDILTSANAQVRPHVIIVDKQIVGFFLIDTIYSQNYSFAQAKSLGLRCFFIDHHHQGKGYAKQALQALPAYLISVYPNHRQIYLTVNCQNLVAKDCYLKHGFQDTDELYHGGAFGPQHVMRLSL